MKTRPRLIVHAYAASFGEDLASEYISRHSQVNDVLLDPFAGAATALRQAQLLRRDAIGIDVDPIACLIARVTCTPYALEELDGLEKTVLCCLGSVEEKLSAAVLDEETCAPGAEFAVDGLRGTVPGLPAIAFWFAPVQRAILSVLVGLANSFTDSRHADIVRLAISSSIIRKWPNTLSLARDIDHSRPHRVNRDDLSLELQLRIFNRVFKKIMRALRSSNELLEDIGNSIAVLEGDSVETLGTLPPDSIDYVLTSPPYFNAIDYPRAHKFSQWWLWQDREPAPRGQYLGLRLGGRTNGAAESLSEKITERAPELSCLKSADPPVHAAFCQYVVDLDTTVRALQRVLRPGKSLTFVLADNIIRGIKLPVSHITCEILRRNGFVAVNAKARTISANRRRYPYGITGFKGLMNSEYVISARKSLRLPQAPSSHVASSSPGDAMPPHTAGR